MTSPIDAHDTDAKLSLQQRQQLSALVDGDLAPDQAAFLLRRLGHDAELAGRWQRWQVIGDVLRRQPVAALPAGDGFAARVAAAMSGEAPRAAAARRPRWPQVAALAASVAVVALLVARPPLGDGAAGPATPGLVATVEAPVAVPDTASIAAPATQPPPPEPVREVSVPQFAEVAPASAPAPGRQVAVASPSDATPPPAMRAVADTADIAPAGATVLAAADTRPSGTTTSDARPFARPDEPQARPWPRATLPGLARPAGEFTVGFDDGGQHAAGTPSFYPFEPQLPPVQVMPGAGAETTDPERIQ